MRENVQFLPQIRERICSQEGGRKPAYQRLPTTVVESVEVGLSRLKHNDHEDWTKKQSLQILRTYFQAFILVPIYQLGFFLHRIFS